MHHIMKQATVRDLRYRFSEIETRLRKGEEVEIRKRRRVIARLLPVGPPPGSYPDFTALSRSIFGKKKTRTTGAELMAEERGRF